MPAAPCQPENDVRRWRHPTREAGDGGQRKVGGDGIDGARCEERGGGGGSQEGKARRTVASDVMRGRAVAGDAVTAEMGCGAQCGEGRSVGVERERGGGGGGG